MHDRSPQPLSAAALAGRAEFALGDMQFRPALHRIEGPSGLVSVEPRVMQVLLVLADAKGAVLSREDLNRLCWQGQIVGDDAVNRAISAIRRALRDAGTASVALETIPRTGYRLIAEPGADDGDNPPRFARRYYVVAAVLAAAAIAIILAFAMRGDRAAAPVDAVHASLAVLPLRNLSGDEDYFADGLTEEIVGQLAGAPRLRVVGRTSAAAMGEGADVRDIGRALDVDHILDGSVRSDGERFRVQVTLVRTSDRSQIWSETFDGGLGDMFAIQQRIGAATARALKMKLTGAPPTGALATRGDVYSLYLTARGLILSRDGVKAATAIELLERAVALDPKFAPAWASLGSARLMSLSLDADERRRDIEAAIGHIRHALALSPDLGQAHGALGMALQYRTKQAVAHVKRAAELSPNDPEIQFWLGNALYSAGDAEGSWRAYVRAARLDPLWVRGSWHAIERSEALGETAVAAELLRQVEMSGNTGTLNLVRSHTALSRGDYSQAIIRYADARKAGSRDGALEFRIARILALLGYTEQAKLRGIDDFEIRMQRGDAPTIAEGRTLGLFQADKGEQGYIQHLAGKAVLARGWKDSADPRHMRALSTFRIATLPSQIPDGILVGIGPLAVLSLRAAGSEAEADTLARASLAAAGRIERRGRVPPWMAFDLAGAMAVAGKREAALAMLEAAASKGLAGLPPDSFADIASEPAFGSLRGDAQFEAIRRTFLAHIARERRETGTLPF